MKVVETSFAHGLLDRTDDRVPTIITDDMKRVRTCVHCHKNYREFGNIGAWQCASHTLKYDADAHWYPCCCTTLPGCVMCDHSEHEVVLYPNSVTQSDDCPNLSGVVPAFRLLVGNLKELHGVHREAIQYPSNYTEVHRALGDEAVIFIYRRCLYGRPDDGN